MKGYVSLLASKTQRDEAELKKAFILTLTPFLFLGLTFLEGIFNLNDIDPILLAVSGLGFIYLQLVLWSSLGRVRPSAAKGVKSADRSVSREANIKPLARWLFLATLLIYAVYVSGLIVPALPFTGDEPHYLLITKSLLSDGDLNLANNYQDKDYLKFYPGDLEPHAYPGKKGEQYLYSKHQPALSVLVAPFYFLGEKLGQVASRRSGKAELERTIIIFFSRLPVCFLAAFLSLAFFFYVWEMTRKKKTAILAWLVSSFSSPLLFYSHLLYPEIPAALILLLVSLQVIQKKNFSSRTLLGAGIGIGLLPWFGLKYVVLAGTMTLILLLFLLRRPEKDAKRAFALVGPILFSAGLYLSLLLHFYGTLSAQTVYLGATPEGSLPLSRFLVSDFLGFLCRLLGYLFDQRVGLFIIAPVYILVLPGFLLLVRRAWKETLSLAGLFSVFWFFCSMNNFYWGGYCPPGRPLLPVLWVPALFMAGAFAFTRNRVALVARDLLAAISLFMAAVFIRSPGLLFQESLGSSKATRSLGMDSLFLAKFNSVFIDWRRLVPSLSSPGLENADWRPLLIWIPAVLSIAALFLISRKSGAPESPLRSLRPRLGGWVLLSVFLIGLASFNLGPEKELILKGQGYEVISQDKNSYPAERDGFWIRGKSKAELLIKTTEPAAKFDFAFSSPVARKTAVRLAGKARRVEKHPEPGFEESIAFLSPPGFRWKGKTYYRLQVEEESGFYPWQIQPGSQDSRFLGVFIKLQVTFPPSNPE